MLKSTKYMSMKAPFPSHSGNKIKIGFCGSHCTGKTTLANRIARFLSKQYEVGVVKEIAREFKKEELRDCKTQYKILISQVKAENEKDEDIIVCDRTVIDNLAYLQQICGYKFIEVENKINSMLINYVGTYDIIFFCLIEGIPLIDDGFRFTNECERKVIEVRVRRILSQYNIKAIELRGDLEMRFKKCREVVCDYLTSKA